MPRNAEKNIYITIAFARTSPTLEQLQREAADMGISVANLIKVLLADRTVMLTGGGKHRWHHYEGASIQPLPTQLESNSEISPPQVKDEGSRRAAAASAAANYWDD